MNADLNPYPALKMNADTSGFGSWLYVENKKFFNEKN
jgi:hypothetical protein